MKSNKQPCKSLVGNLAKLPIANRHWLTTLNLLCSWISKFSIAPDVAECFKTSHYYFKRHFHVKSKGKYKIKNKKSNVVVHSFDR